jgi:hypothetical protein
MTKKLLFIESAKKITGFMLPEADLIELED